MFRIHAFASPAALAAALALSALAAGGASAEGMFRAEPPRADAAARGDRMVEPDPTAGKRVDPPAEETEEATAKRPFLTTREAWPDGQGRDYVMDRGGDGGDTSHR